MLALWMALLAGCGGGGRPAAPPVFQDITALKIWYHKRGSKEEMWMSLDQGRDIAICLLQSYRISKEHAKGKQATMFDIEVTDMSGHRTEKYVLINDRTLQKGNAFYHAPCLLPLVSDLDDMKDHL